MGSLRLREDRAGVVGGTVVDADQLNLQGDGEDMGDDFVQRGLLVVDGHDYGEFHGVRIRHSNDLDGTRQGGTPELSARCYFTG
jgi:hypothetical protein